MKKILSLFLIVTVLFSAFAVHSFSKNEEMFPSKYSSVDMGYVSPAENQYNSENCWAFSTLGALSAYSVKYGIHTLAEANFSEAHLAWFNGRSRNLDESSPVYGDGMISDDPYEEGARIFQSVFALAGGSGIAYEINYPFMKNNDDMGDYPEGDRYDHAAGLLSEANLLNTDGDIKEGILRCGSVEAGIYLDETKMTNTVKRKYVGGEYQYTGSCCYCNKEKEGYGHDILIVGWDDDYPASNFKGPDRPSSNGAWLCKNSWGSEWGENGFFWISYENAHLLNLMTYECVAGDRFDTVYQYDGYGFGKRISSPGVKTASAANIFTAENRQVLEKVGFYTYQNASGISDVSAEVKIDIYKDIPSGSRNPAAGTLALTCTVNEEYSGFHTVELPNSVVLDAGTVFSVVITVTAAQGNAYVPVESPQGEKFAYNACEGLSFISFGGTGNFFDAAKKYSGNVCVKAYTRNYDGNSVSGVRLDAKEKTVFEGDVFSLHATVMPLGKDADITWNSSDDSIATVADDGVVTAHNRGTAVITATAENESAKMIVTVIPETVKIKWIIGEQSIETVCAYGSRPVPPGNVPVGYKLGGWAPAIPDRIYDNAVFTAVLNCVSSIAVPRNTKVNWKERVTVYARSENVPSDCILVIKEGSREINRVSPDKNGYAEIKADCGEATAEHTYTVSVVDSSGQIVKDASGNEISKSFSVSVNSGFFAKLIAFFKGLFGSLPNVVINP